MHDDNRKVIEEFRGFIAQLKATPGVTVRARVGRPASAENCLKYEGVLSPALLEFARAADGLGLEWFRKGSLQGALQVQTLRQFSQNKDSHGLEVTDGQVVQRFNAAGAGDFVCMFGQENEVLVFDGDSLQPMTEGSLADVLRAGMKASFRKGWEARLNAMAEQAEPAED